MARTERPAVPCHQRVVRRHLQNEAHDVISSAATDRPTRIAGEQDIGKLKIEGDLHGSAEYKKQLLRVYLKRAIDETRNARR